MSSPIIRCPICREPVEATEEALTAHEKGHSSWALFRSLWGLDRRAALFIGYASAVVVAALVLWLLVSIGVG